MVVQALILPFARRPRSAAASMPCLTRPAPVGAGPLSTAACSTAELTAARSCVGAPFNAESAWPESVQTRSTVQRAPNLTLQLTGEDARSRTRVRSTRKARVRSTPLLRRLRR